MTSREKFEAWMTAEQWFHGSDFEWDERRNCYAQFGIHLAYKAFLEAEGAAEQKLTDMAVQLANAESKCRELAVAENNLIDSECHVAELEESLRDKQALLEAADKLQDSAFRHGLQHGFSYGQTNDQAGYEQCLNSYSSRGKDNG